MAFEIVFASSPSFLGIFSPSLAELDTRRNFISHRDLLDR